MTRPTPVNPFDEDVARMVAVMHEDADRLEAETRGMPPALSVKAAPEQEDFLLDFPELMYPDEGLERGMAAAQLEADVGPEKLYEMVLASWKRRMGVA